MKKRCRFGWIQGCLAGVSLLWLAPLLCGYPLVKTFCDGLAADGSMERLTPQFFQELSILFWGLSLIHLLLLLWSLCAPAGFRSFFSSLGSLPHRFVLGIRPFFRDLARAASGSAAEWILLLLIVSLAAAVRLLLIDRPLLHDEAYSIVTWGSADFRFAVSDYHLPNNHLFHTMLINWIYHHIGKSVPLMRMPVFLSGTLLVPAVWLLGKRLYNANAGLLGAGLCAFAPFLIDYSTNARGYELQALLSLLCLMLAVYLLNHKNIFAWTLLILTAALDFFTLPIALYPFGGICVWFLLCILFKQTGKAYHERWNFFKYLIFCGLLSGLLSLLLYTPLFLSSGLSSFFGNSYVGPVPPGEFWQTSLSRLQDNFHAFTDTLPAVVWAALLVGNLLALVFHRRISKIVISYQLALFLCMAGVIAFQQPNLWPRTLLFLHPLLILWGSAGIVFFLDWLCSLTGWRGARWIAVSLAAGLVTAAGFSQFELAETIRKQNSPDERAVYSLLKREGSNSENVLFVTAAQDNAPIWFYADCEGLPKKIFDKTQPFNTVYAFVNPFNDAYNGPKTLDELMNAFGPGDAFILADSEEVLMDEPDGILYRFDGNLSAIEKAYHALP